MQTDPLETGMDPDPTDPTQGTPTPTGDLQKRIAQLEQENAKLREDRRAERAEKLGAQHQLTPTQTELLKLVPADQMEEKAKALESERAGTQAPPAPTGDVPAEGAPPPGEPPTPPDPGMASFDSQPSGTPPGGDPALGAQDELQKRLAKADSLEEIAAIQRELKSRQRSG